MEDETEITVKIKVPTYWLTHPDKEYEEIRQKIYNRWALVEYFTGKKAEDWVRDNIKHEANLGTVTFYDATAAVENAVEAAIGRISR